MRLVFCGTPQFAVPTLQQVLRAGHTVELAVTQPDRPIGRSQELSPPPVKILAQQAGIPVLQPERIKNNPEFAARLRQAGPEAILVVAYGRIIPRWMLDLPPLGNLNLHASLLPKYRGAAPIQWAVANGETVTGVTTMRIDEGLDTGDILLQREVPIGPRQTAEELFPILAETGASLMVETLRRLDPDANDPIRPIPQDDSAATFAPVLKREDACIDFSRTAEEIDNRWRGFQPWPGAYTFFRGKRLTVHRLARIGARFGALVPGSIVAVGERLFAAAAQDSWIEILELQLEGKRRLAAAEFLRGASLRPGERFGQ